MDDQHIATQQQATQSSALLGQEYFAQLDMECNILAARQTALDRASRDEEGGRGVNDVLKRADAYARFLLTGKTDSENAS